MRKSTYAPQKISEFQASKLTFNGRGAAAECAAGTDTILDIVLEDDNLITGGELITYGAATGDHITAQIVDIDNIMGYGAGAVLNTFMTNWRVKKGDSSYNLLVNYPAKVPAGLAIRIIYTSAGTVDSTLEVNYMLHKVMI